MVIILIFNDYSVSELEARIITAFNDFLYESLAPNFTIEPNRRYGEILHLTYFVKSEISDSAAKFIISVPKDILLPKEKEAFEPKFTDNDFLDCPVEVDLLLGNPTKAEKELGMHKPLSYQIKYINVEKVYRKNDSVIIM